MAELVVSGLWAPFYFRAGIPVFSRTLLYAGERESHLLPEALSRKFSSTLGASLLFRQLGPDEIAFRESFFEFSLFHYPPVMHGLIRFDDAPGVVTVTGYASLWPLFMLTAGIAARFLGGLPPGAALPALGVLLASLSVCYAIQAWRFNGVYRELERRLKEA